MDMISKRDGLPPIGLTTYHSRLIFGTVITCVILTTATVILRVYARRFQRQRFDVEDHLVFVSLITYYAMSILTACAVFLGGTGHPEKSLDPGYVTISLKMLAGQGVCYGVIMTCSKCSLCLFYIRVFALKSFRIVARIIMGIIIAWGLLAAVVTWGFCQPIAFNWDKTIPGGHCANEEAGFLVVGIVDALTDFAILVLPLPVIWNLHLPMVQKLGLLVIFSIGTVSIVISGIRAKFTDDVDFHDFTDSTTLLHVFSAIEPATSIMVASLLIVGPMLRKKFHRGDSSNNRSKGTTRSFKRMNDEENIQLKDASELHQYALRDAQSSQRSLSPAPGETYTADVAGGQGTKEKDAGRPLESDGIRVDREFYVRSDV